MSGEWINFKDKQPNIYDFVLVFSLQEGSEPYSVSIARLTDDGWEFLAAYNDGSGIGAFTDLEWPASSENITHWMPLPLPPQTGEKQ